MATYHLTANVISRARGQSVVAAAAYRSGTRLRDERYGTIHDYTGKRRVTHVEIIAPAEAPEWAHDRGALWNRVEAAELRKDSQLARVIELGVPVELTHEQTVGLVSEYVRLTFVAKGMIADVSIRRDNPDNPLAQVLLTLREVTASGFGRKARHWNGKTHLLEWRAAWAERANEHLARAGYTARIDHRTLEHQQIELTPTRRVGIGPGRAADERLPAHLADRIAERRRIARDNGAAILEDPSVALRALAHRSTIFSPDDIARFLRSRTDPDHYAEAQRAVLHCAELVPLQPAPDGTPRYTSRDLVDAAKSLMRRTRSMATRRGRGVTAPTHGLLAASFTGGRAPLRQTFIYLVEEGDVKAVALAHAEANVVLTAALRAWEAEGLRVSGVTPSHSADDALAVGTGLTLRVLEHCEADWRQGLELPTAATVLMVFRAEMISLKSLERVLAIADKARAKVVLVSDVARLSRMPADLPFRDVLLAIGPARVVPGSVS